MSFPILSGFKDAGKDRDRILAGEMCQERSHTQTLFVSQSLQNTAPLRGCVKNGALVT